MNDESRHICLAPAARGEGRVRDLQLGSPAFRDALPCHDQQQPAGQGEDAMHGPPSSQVGQHRTQGRGKHRDDAEHHRHVGSLAPRGVALEQILHHREGQHRARASADSLRETRDHQRGGGRRQHAGQACGGVADQPEEQHRPAPETVGKQASAQLSHGKAAHEQRQGEARHHRGCPERVRQQHQRRRANVDRERGQRGEQAQHDREREGGWRYAQRRETHRGQRAMPEVAQSILSGHDTKCFNANRDADGFPTTFYI